MSAATERQDRTRAQERWVAAGLSLERLARPSVESVRAAAPWVNATLAEVPALPPAGVVADFGALLSGKPFDVSSAVLTDDAQLKSAIRAYEYQLLGRLAADERLEAAVDAFARLPASLQPSAVGVMSAALLERLHFADGEAITPAVVRSIGDRASLLVEEGALSLRRDPALAARLAHAYEGLAHGAQGARSLLTDADVFTLENLAVLGSLAQRLAVAQIVEAAERVARALPKRMRQRKRAEGSSATPLEDEAAYPIGGFSAISTSGSLENLVTSELIYMEESADDVDLFDMRYVEGELLFYTRDEAIFVRRRRVVSFLLEDDLVDARFKDKGAPFQRIVFAMGVVLCAIKRLVEALGDQDLLFRVVFTTSKKSIPLAAERAQMELLLREWIEKGTAEIVEATYADALEQARAASRRALSQVVVVSTKDRAEELRAAKDRRIETTSLWVDAHDADAWGDATLELVRTLL